MKLKDLLDQRARVIAAMREITNKPANGEDLSEEQETRFNQLKSELAGVEKKIERQQLLDDAERRSHGEPLNENVDQRWQSLCGRLSIAKAIMAFDPSIDAGAEREASKEMEIRTGKKPQGILLPSEIFIERRDQIAGDLTKGGALVGTVNRPDLLVDRLRAASALSALGVTVLNGLVGYPEIPKVTGSAAVQWIGEGDSPSVNDASFGQINLSPKTAAAQMAYSRRMLINATPAIESLLRDDLAKSIAEAVDVAAINGDGVAAPFGLLRREGLPVVALGTNGAAPSIDSMIDLTGKLDTSNALAGNLKWLTNPSYVSTASKIKDSQGRYLLLDQLPSNLLGYPLVRTTSVPKNLTKGSGTNLSAAIFGDWSSMLLGLWSGIDILSNPYSQAAQGKVLIHAFQDCDVNVRHLESFAAHVDAVTS